MFWKNAEVLDAFRKWFYFCTAIQIFSVHYTIFRKLWLHLLLNTGKMWKEKRNILITYWFACVTKGAITTIYKTSVCLKFDRCMQTYHGHRVPFYRACTMEQVLLLDQDSVKTGSSNAKKATKVSQLRYPKAIWYLLLVINCCLFSSSGSVISPIARPSGNRFSLLAQSLELLHLVTCRTVLVEFQLY